MFIVLLYILLHIMLSLCHFGKCTLIVVLYCIITSPTRKCASQFLPVLYTHAILPDLATQLGSQLFRRIILYLDLATSHIAKLM